MAIKRNQISKRPSGNCPSGEGGGNVVLRLTVRQPTQPWRQRRLPLRPPCTPRKAGDGAGPAQRLCGNEALIDDTSTSYCRRSTRRPVTAPVGVFLRLQASSPAVSPALVMPPRA